MGACSCSPSVAKEFDVQARAVLIAVGRTRGDDKRDEVGTWWGYSFGHEEDVVWRPAVQVREQRSSLDQVLGIRDDKLELSRW